MNRPTQEQITAEIAKLREIKPRVRRSSAFGDDHHAAIDAQVEVLEDRMDEDQIYDRSEMAEDDIGFYSENTRDQALEARRWMRGEQDTAPSAGWAELVEGE